MKKLLTITRWIYAIFFLLMGAQALLVYAGILPKAEYPGSPEIKDFSNAVFSTGFIGPIMSVTYFSSGILMLFNRTAPLGIVLLTPFVVVILFTHLMLNGNPPLGILVAFLLGVFAWQFRKAYKPMWNYGNQNSNDS
jgi:hypothetical protein